MKSCRRLAVACYSIAASLLLAAAPAPPSATVHAPVPQAAVTAHPAMWTLHGPKATIYLLGSIHVLRPQMQWHTPQIDAALKAADTFVFEIPMAPSQNARIQE